MLRALGLAHYTTADDIVAVQRLSNKAVAKFISVYLAKTIDNKLEIKIAGIRINNYTHRLEIAQKW